MNASFTIEHAPERDLDPVSSALAGVDVHYARCRCGGLDGPEVRDGADLRRAFASHMRDVQAAARSVTA
ncbi:hypothetical protein [Nonomuraea sp. NPDC005650]|uniref:hypothetical protein n=1 Tax=Nonomuraea sp. NPDC005650 TaxID=3157045 RepID=UPI0033BC150B